MLVAKRVAARGAQRVVKAHALCLLVRGSIAHEWAAAAASYLSTTCQLPPTSYPPTHVTGYRQRPHMVAIHIPIHPYRPETTTQSRSSRWRALASRGSKAGCGAQIWKEREMHLFFLPCQQ